MNLTPNTITFIIRELIPVHVTRLITCQHGNFSAGKGVLWPTLVASFIAASKYRLDAEAKGSTGFRILKTHIKSQGRQPEAFMTCLKNFKTVDPIG